MFLAFNAFEKQRTKFISAKFQKTFCPEYISLRIQTKGQTMQNLELCWPRGYKTFSMLSSVEHEISNAHK